MKIKKENLLMALDVLAKLATLAGFVIMLIDHLS
jgi:hypothetical protein